MSERLPDPPEKDSQPMVQECQIGGADVPEAPAHVSSSEFFARARSRLTFEVPPSLTDASIIPKAGDWDETELLAAAAKNLPLRAAAVLVPVVAHEEPTVLLTQRSPHLNDHAGQIAFPGGKIDPSDPTPMHAAIREAHEEIGLEPEFIEPIGYSEVYGTPRGFRILPTVARISPGFTLKINHTEVDEVFEVPLAFLMNPANHKLASREFETIKRHFYEMPYGDRYVWGATAGMLRILYERIFAA